MLKLIKTALSKIKTLPEEGRVLITVALGLLALEFAFRLGDSSLSKDVDQLNDLAKLGIQINAAHERGNRSLLVLGNSLARCAIAPSLIGQQRGTGTEDETFLMTPDGSNVTDWLYAYDRYILHSGTTPTTVWIITGKTHLNDAPIDDPERLGHYFVDGKDRGEVLLNQLPDLGTRCRFILGSVSTMFANRLRIQPLVFYNAVPGYENTARAISQRLPIGDQPIEINQAPKPTFLKFRHLLEAVQKSGSKATIISAPLPLRYALDAEVISLAHEYNAAVIELGNEPPLPAEAFSDGYHLTPAAAHSVTERILGDLKMTIHPLQHSSSERMQRQTGN